MNTLNTVLTWLTLGLFSFWRPRGMGLCPPADELWRRRPAWAVLSELYLDTELGPGDYRGMANALRASGYSADELEQILFLELHPLLVWNLLNVAGEWAGFDLEGIEWHVLRRFRPKALPVRLLFARNVVDAEWQAVRRLLDASDSSLAKSG